MSRQPYLTAPQPITTMPPGIPYIVGNEAAERFSFYGMRAILTIYMVKHIVGWHGEQAFYSEEDAKAIYHQFVASAYFFPIFGALLSDWLLGKYRTIISLSLVYCLGHLLLATVPGREGLLIGLTLIAIGSGGIKPCVSAHVGDQFGERNQHLLTRVFSWFYFSINFGAFFSQLLTPMLLVWYGPHVAFGVPGVLMGLATLVFWLGRHKFVHVPPGGTRFLRESFSAEGLQAVAKLVPIYLCVAMFWALFDQQGSSWILQLEKMDLHWQLLGWSGRWESSQIQSVNGLLILVFIPLFSYVVYPVLNKLTPMTPLKKMSIGFFITVLAFVAIALIEEGLEPLDAIAVQAAAERNVPVSDVIAEQVAAGQRLSYGWQVLAYVIMTAAEVMISITGLEFSYTQAPNRMKSLIMSLWLLAVAVGNQFTSLVNRFIKNPDGTNALPGASYYWFFTAVIGVTALTFVVIAATYRERRYIQESEPV